MDRRFTFARSTSLRTLVACIAVMLAVTALFGARLVSADHEGEVHLAHIHPGTCDDLNPEPEYPLFDVAEEFSDGEDALAGDSIGSIDRTLLVEGSVTVIDGLTLDDITGDDPYAINLHQSAEDAATYIACGNVAGQVIDENTLAIGLEEQNDSGHSGVAVLTNIDGGLRVTLYVTVSEDDEASADADADEDADAADADATADADADADDEADADADADAAADDAAEDEDADADADADAASDETAVSIVDFDFEPAETTVPVGTTVTWTNDGGAPHTVTADDESFDSGNLAGGDTFTFTFEAEGEFTYICKIHPSMRATVIVE